MWLEHDLAAEVEDARLDLARAEMEEAAATHAVELARARLRELEWRLACAVSEEVHRG